MAIRVYHLVVEEGQEPSTYFYGLCL